MQIKKQNTRNNFIMSTVDLYKSINSFGHISPEMKVLFNGIGYGTIKTCLSILVYWQVLNTSKLQEN